MISALYSTEGLNPKFFKRSAPLLQFAEKFHVLNGKMCSSLFNDIWSATVESKSTGLQVDNLYEMVWKPAFSKCEKFIQELQQQTMALGDVKRFFKNYSEHTITTHIRILFEGINKCNQEDLSSHWIGASVRKIMHYRELCSVHDAANSFLELRSLLKLAGGDFEDIEKISSEVMPFYFIISYLILFFTDFIFYG